MDFLSKAIFLNLFLFKFSYCYVILSGGPYCSTDGYSVSHAVPGTTVSITCAVDNPDGVTNGLTWSIPSFGVTLAHTGWDIPVAGTELKSTVTDSNSGTGRTNATLSFHAVSVLDKAIVQCRNNDNPPESRNCTLFIQAPPTAPMSFICSDITNNSLTLQWDEPTDNGGEEVLLYNIARTPRDISIVETGNNVTIENLLPNIKYHLTIRAGNSIGLGNGTSVECTTKEKTPPTAPISFNCTNITNDSLTLQWGEPTDNGGEVKLRYNITGTPEEISIVKEGNTATLDNLLPNNKYNLTIRAGNSVGFGNEISVECTTEGKRPPMFNNVTVCLDVSDTDPNNKTKVIVDYTLCPLVTDDFTPEVTNYRVLLNGSNVADSDSDPCSLMQLISTEDMSAFTVDVFADNSAGSTKTPYRNGAVFHASWLRNVNVTDITTSSAVIQYTTADCVLSSDLIVELISPNSSMVDGDTTHHYENETTSSFSFTSLIQGSTVMFTLQVTADSSITVYSTTSSFIVPFSSPIVPTTKATSTASESNLATDLSPTVNSPPPKLTSDMLSSIGAIVGAIVAVVAISVLILAIVACVYCKKRSLSKTSGSSLIPISLCEPKQSQTDTGQVLYEDACTTERHQVSVDNIYTDNLRRQTPPSKPPIELETATYQDPNSIERQQAPTGDMYALPDKPRRQPPAPSLLTSVTELDTATYQDPNTVENGLYTLADKPWKQTPASNPQPITEEGTTYQDPSSIERQQAPTGDIYTVPQKKPQCSNVNEDSKSSGAMYFELGLGGSSHPLPQEDNAQEECLL